MHQGDRVVSQIELTEHIYAQDFERGSNTLEVFIGRLRRNTGFAAHLRERFGLIGWSDLSTLAYFLPLQAFFGTSNSMSSALGEEIGWRGFLAPELARSMRFSAGR
jgi:membrane protease YdiL (CAAX protease family)